MGIAVITAKKKKRKKTHPSEPGMNHYPKQKPKFAKKINLVAPAANRTRGPSMATMDFTTKPLALIDAKTSLP